MKKFELEVVTLNVADVITTSGEWCMPECGGELPEA